MSVERFDLDRIAPQRWRNGAGLTREIARGGGADGDFDWRFSVAEIEHDAPFSAFPGIDRHIVLLRGAGMRLRSPDGRIDHALIHSLAPFEFDGEIPLDATLLDGPCRDLNVMTRRGVIHAEVACHRVAAELADAELTLLLCSAGEWRVDADRPFTLAPLQALLWRAPHGLLRVRSTHADAAAALLAVRLCHDRPA